MARVNNAIAQYSKDRAQWTTDLTTDPNLYTEVENADGTVSKVYQWEDASERYDQTSQGLQQRIMEDNNFKTNRARMALQKGFTVNDEQFATKVQKFVGDRKIDRGRAADMETLEEYKAKGNIPGIEILRNEMIQGGRWDASSAYSVTNSAIRTASYSQTIKQIQQMSDQNGVAALMQEIQAGEGHAAKMTVHQRQQAISEGNDRLLGLHYEDMRLTHNNKGPAAALDLLNTLADGGPEATGAMDEVTHMKMIGNLRTGMDRLAKIDADRSAGQASSNLNDSYFGGTANLDASTASSLTYTLREKAARDVVDGQAQAFLQTFNGRPPQDFYNSPVITDHLLMGARVNHVATPYEAKIESDIRGGSLLAADKVRQIEAVVPGAFRGLSDDVRKKIEYIETHDDLQLPGDVNESYAQVQSMPASEKERYAEIERINFNPNTGETPQEAFAASRERLELDKRGFWSNTVTGTDPYVDTYWKQAYSEYLPFVKGDHNKAADAATRATMRTFGVTTAYGEPQFEENAPEVLYNTPGREPSAPSADFNAQYDFQVKNLNLMLEAGDKQERYSRENTRRKYLGIDPADNQHTWILHDMSGHPVMESDGVVFTMKFNPAGINAEADQIVANNKKGLRYVQEQAKVAAAADFEAATFEDAPADPLSGQIAPTVTEAIDLNATRWDGLNDEQRADYNWQYQAAFNALVDENNALLHESNNARPINRRLSELQAHLFLATRGYMRGDVDGNYVRPPGGY